MATSTFPINAGAHAPHAVANRNATSEPRSHLCLAVLHQLRRLLAVLRDVPVLLLQQLLHLLVNLGGFQVLVQRLQLQVLSLQGAGNQWQASKNAVHYGRLRRLHESRAKHSQDRLPRHWLPICAC